MFKKILHELKKSSFTVLPIYFLIIILVLFNIVDLNGYEILSFSLSTILIIVGIALFNYGAEYAMTPIGKNIGKGLTKRGNTWLLLVVVFLFAFFITISEPDLSVLALQTSSVFPKILLLISISVFVGLFIVLSIIKIIHKINLVRILSVLYMVCFSLVALLIDQGKESLVALAFDSGGVTTGPMTVPFLMALGAGVASILSTKSEKDASFGFVAFSSIGPILIMLILSLFFNKEMRYELADYTIPENFIVSYFEYFLEKIKDVGLSIGLLFICYLIIDIIFLNNSKEKIVRLSKDIFIAFLGLVLFLAAVDCTYMGVGYKIGTNLSKVKPELIIFIAMIIGALTVLAEPAIKILITQVEEITNGLIKKRSMLSALTIGVGVAISLSLLRIIYQISILYIIIPGYVLCFILSFFIPKIYTAIAFDAGGVASGPMTSSFILPIALGLCASLNGVEQILSYGFGVVALVALSPMLTLEILGLLSVIHNRRIVKSEIAKVLKEDDKIIILFGD